ncbi:MAG: U32 family peptidase [Phycisphaerales bacterium]|nr:U32 family peptidase [Phycisphaerales bacterium]
MTQRKQTTRASLELLSPAGNTESLRAAVANGADAVYLGLTDFNARRRADNFQPEQLTEVMAFLHMHNVRGYVTVNTLIFPDELPLFTKRLEMIASAGADAVIVQDLSAVALARQIAPTLPVHASTQMTLTEPHGIEQVRALGVSRVILARELTLDQIARVARATESELEVFVHGAICFSYSGQCLASLARGGRSANRGLCAQPCRLEYELFVDGQARNLEDKKHLLSPSDLTTWRRVGELADTGVHAVKIEGRLKSAEYVAAVTSLYRKAIDAASAGVSFQPDPQHLEAVAHVFARNISEGFLGDTDRRKFIDGRSPTRRGLLVGTVVRADDRYVIIEMAREYTGRLKPGDGLAFAPDLADGNCSGGRIYGVDSLSSRQMRLAFAREDLDPRKLSAGMCVWKTDDPAIGKRLRASYTRVEPTRRVGLSARISAQPDTPLSIEFSDEAGHNVRVESDHPLAAALHYPLTLDDARRQLDRLGSTPFALDQVELCGPEGPTGELPVMVPASILNQLRRQGVQSLIEARQNHAKHDIVDRQALANLRANLAFEPSPPITNTYLSILVRTREQSLALCEKGLQLNGKPHLVYADPQDIDNLPPMLDSLRRAGFRTGASTVRILPPDHEVLLDRIIESRPDAVLIRNIGSLGYLRTRLPGIEMVADFSFNIVNDVSGALLLRWGVRRITPGFDLADDAMPLLLEHLPATCLEMPVYYRIPLFHTRYCPKRPSAATK